ncbi:ATP-binding protein [Caulobacter sp. UC70_42]|uniref:ATP-binding protein n=1 Tax=Caulobacter sp. UC70_42 TaxID=3374551 RepID=UPI003757369F
MVRACQPRRWRPSPPRSSAASSSRNRRTGGAGLGLSIVQALAKGQGGRLILSNRPEGGLAATITLPSDAP